MRQPLPPIRAVAELEPVSRCIVHFRASDLSLNSVSGQLATFSRGAAASVTDSNAATFSLGNQQPAWETKVWASSVRCIGLTLDGLDDRWSVAAAWKPKAFGFYHEFVQSGSMASNNVALWSIAIAAGTGARVVLDSTGTYYRLRHHNGSAEVTVTLAAAPTTGQRVVMWGYVYADGSIQLWQSINEAAATNTAASAANALASTWQAATKLHIGSLGTTDGAPAWHRCFKLVAGLPTLAQLTRYF